MLTLYGLVVLDIGLPDGYGLDLCRELRAAGSPARVLVLTARDTLSDKVGGLDAGADDYLTKPLTSLSCRPGCARSLVARPTPARPSSPLATCGSIPPRTRSGVATWWSRSRPGRSLCSTTCSTAKATSCAADTGPAVVVEADMALLRQAVDNAVRNAARRAPNVRLESRIDGRDGVLAVLDDGPGFDPAVLPHVFDRFRRGDSRGEVGLGLALVQAILAAHGGAAAADNRPEGGAVVTLRVPLSRAALT